MIIKHMEYYTIDGAQVEDVEVEAVLQQYAKKQATLATGETEGFHWWSKCDAIYWQLREELDETWEIELNV